MPTSSNPKKHTSYSRLSAMGRTAVLGLAATLIAAGLASAAPPNVVQASGDFTFGGGLSGASVVDYDINSGGANLNVYTGYASATYQDTAADALSANVYFPLAGLLGALTICSQPAPAVPLPAPLTADTATNGNTAKVSSSDSTAGNTIGVRTVSAQPGSAATAQDDLVASSVPAIVDVQGGESRADINVSLATQTRVASAEVGISNASVLGGAVKLGGLHWQLQQSEVGADSRSDHRTSSASFTMSSITVGAVSIPVTSPDQLAQAVAQANGLLAPVGLALRLPVASVGAGTDGHVLSPLTVAVVSSKAVWAPVIAAIFNNPNLPTIENAVAGTLFDPQHCNELFGLLQSTGQFNVYYNLFGAAAPLVIGILGQALSGSGELDINLGGLRTNLDDTYFPSFNFGFASAPTFSGGDNTTSTIGGFSPAASIAPPAPVRPVAPPAAIQKLDIRCETVSPAGRPSCWEGQAVRGAALVGALLVGLLAADEIYRRRRTRALMDLRSKP